MSAVVADAIGSLEVHCCIAGFSWRAGQFFGRVISTLNAAVVPVHAAVIGHRFNPRASYLFTDPPFHVRACGREGKHSFAAVARVNASASASGREAGEALNSLVTDKASFSMQHVSGTCICPDKLSSSVRGLVSYGRRSMRLRSRRTMCPPTRALHPHIF